MATRQNFSGTQRDSAFRANAEWLQKHKGEARSAVVILCKSTAKNDLGCNQTKGSRLFVPHGRGLAYTRADLDLNWTPIRDRPFPFTASS
jgi:hypothetical protein